MDEGNPKYPIPFDQDDLQGVLTNLSRRHNRSLPPGRDPNEPVTRWLLEAGVSLLTDRYLQHEDDREVEAYIRANDVLGSISVQDIIRRFESLYRDQGGDPGRSSRTRLQHRWGTTAKYQRDLLQYIFRPSIDRYRIRIVQTRLSDLYRLPFGHLVETLAISETNDVGGMPEHQLQLTLLAAFPSDPQIRELASSFYARSRDSWAEIYAGIAEVYGIALLPEQELGWVDVALMFNAVIEGVYIRRCADQSVGVTATGVHLSVKVVQMLLAEMTGESWSSLAERRAV